MLWRDLRRRDHLAARARRYRMWSRDRSGRFLLFDSRGDGRVAEVVGDLERAHDLAVVVPGTGSDLHTFERHLAPRARELEAATARLGTSEVAVVAWLGYDAPDTLPAAALGGHPRRGGRALARFVDGLEVRENPHTTVIGHLLRIGGRRQRRGEQPDARGRRRVHRQSQHGRASARRPGARPALALLSGRGAGRPRALGAPSTARHRAIQSSERGPSTPRGDERPLHRVVGNHQGYYRRGSASLRNLARIVAGRRAEVTRPPACRRSVREGR